MGKGDVHYDHSLVGNTSIQLFEVLERFFLSILSDDGLDFCGLYGIHVRH